MTTKSVSTSNARPATTNIRQLVNTMTIIAWIVLGIGVFLCLTNLSQFNDKNVGLMVGIGFLIGSVHIYVIGTAMGLVHARKQEAQQEEEG